MAGKAALNEAVADSVYRPQYEVKPSEVKNYYDNAVKTRQLSEHEKNLRNLTIVGSVLKVEKIISYNKNPGAVEPLNISEAMVRKMQEHPKWDVALDSQSISILNTHADLLKKTFGEKSYGWAWVLNQRGQKSEAKKILHEVYETGYQNIMQMRMTHFDGVSPLTESEFVLKALAPMIQANEKLLLDSKMQMMKSHFSNLPNSNMLT